MASLPTMNKKYWDDLLYEGRMLTQASEGVPRNLSKDIADSETGRASTRRDAERYRKSMNDIRPRYRNRLEHQLQDVIDAYRFNHPEAANAVPRNIGFSRPSTQ